MSIKKLIGLLIIILLISIFLSDLARPSSAAYSDKFANYPGYKELIDTLQKAHPNWEFEIYETGLNWSDVIKEESTHYRNVTHILGGGWSCATCGNKTHENRWYCASPTTIAYYMDPRNSLNESYIFQFEKLTYNSDLQTKEGVEQILKDCKYMQGKITYYDTKGAKKNIDKTYSEVIIEAAKDYNISAYHLAARIRQEMGTGKGSTIISGTISNYKGYYNYYNWGAYGSDIIGSGLKTAKEKGWTDPEKAIKGGAQLVSKEYVALGQNTLYFQKFNVSNKNSLYTHQYMTNVSASKSEGSTVKKTYTDMGLLNKKVVFRIPAYKNMPTYACPEPGKETIVTQDVQTNGEVNIREGKGTDTKTITTLKKGVKLLRIEYAQKKEKDYYWDKVVLADGTQGYAIRNRLNNLSLQSNCNEKDIVLNNTEVRNGPGKTGTAIVTYVAPGNLVTVVEKGKYPKLDEEDWWRIRLSDNTYGYIAVGTSSNSNIVKYDEDSPDYDYVKVVCSDGLNIRRKPTTSENNIMATIAEGTELFRAQKVASTAEGYIWDKVVTSNGIVGYCVRKDKKTGQEWIQSLSKRKYEVDDKNKSVVCVPDMTPEKLKDLSFNVVVKNGDKTIEKNQTIGTGYTIIIDGKTYTAIVKGDPSCDGAINSADLLKIVKHLKKTGEIKDSNVRDSADVNSDGSINSADLLKIVKHLKNTGSIEI